MTIFDVRRQRLRWCLMATWAFALLGCMSTGPSATPPGADPGSLVQRATRSTNTQPPIPCDPGLYRYGRPVARFHQPSVDASNVASFLREHGAGQSNQPFNSFFGWGPWPNPDLWPAQTLTSTLADYAYLTDFTPVNKAAAQWIPNANWSYVPAGGWIGPSVMQVEGPTVAFWVNGITDRQMWMPVDPDNQYHDFGITEGQVDCSFNTTGLDNTELPVAFATNSASIHGTVDFEATYDGNAAYYQPGVVNAFSYWLFGFHAVPKPGAAPCFTLPADGGLVDDLWVEVELYNRETSLQRLLYIAPDTTPDNTGNHVNGLIGARAVEDPTWWNTDPTVPHFSTANPGQMRHYDVTFTYDKFLKMLQEVSQGKTLQMSSCDPLDYRLSVVGLHDELHEPRCPPDNPFCGPNGTAKPFFQLGVKFKDMALETRIPARGDLFAIKRYDAWAGQSATGVHQLLAAKDYQQFGANQLSGFPQESASWAWIAGAPDLKSGNNDLLGIDPGSDGGQAHTSIHLAGASSGYARFDGGDWITSLPATDTTTWQFLPGVVNDNDTPNQNGMPDLIAIQTGSTTFVNIVRGGGGATAYQARASYRTALAPTELHGWRFVVGSDHSNGQHRPDIIAVRTNDVDANGNPTGYVGFYVLDGTRGYTGTPVHITSTIQAMGDRFEFVSGSERPGQAYRDVLIINRGDMATHTSVSTIQLSASGAQKLSETTTPLGQTPWDNWVYSSTPPL